MSGVDAARPRAGWYTPPLATGAPMDGHGKAFAYFALFTEIGLVLFVTTLGGALAGHWLDEQLAHEPPVRGRGVPGWRPARRGGGLPPDQPVPGEDWND